MPRPKSAIIRIFLSGALGLAICLAPDVQAQTCTFVRSANYDANADPVEPPTTLLSGDFVIVGLPGNSGDVGDGRDEFTRWIYDYKNDLATINLLDSLQLSVAKLDVEFEGGGGNDDIGISGLTQFLAFPSGVDTMQSYNLLDHYTAGAIIRKINEEQTSSSTGVTALEGELLMGFQDDGRVKSAKLELVFNQECPVDRIRITSPPADTLVIPGDSLVIRWESSGVDSVDIFLSTDKTLASQFTINSQRIPASDGEFTWEVPDSLTRFASLQIEDSKDPSVTDSVAFFRIKGFQLTRVDSEDEYEAFDVTRHGWSFCNCRTHLAPPQAYDQKEQFDYSLSGTDPFTGSGYFSVFSAFRTATSSVFGDWPSWVRAFGEQAAYISKSPTFYNPRLLTYWESKRDSDWGGSCSGFAVTAQLAFSYPDRFATKFPTIGKVTELNSAVLVSNGAPDVKDIHREAINQTAQYLGGRFYIDHALSVYSKPLPEVVKELQDVLLNRDESHFWDRGFLFISRSHTNPDSASAHAVTPYNLVRKGNGKFELSIYDPNWPYSTDRVIQIDTTAASWSYLPEYPKGGPFFLSNRVLDFSDFNAVYRRASETTKKAQTDELVVSTTSREFLTIETSSGPAIQLSDGLVQTSIEGAYPLTTPTGYESVPGQYVLPNGSYLVSFDSSERSGSIGRLYVDQGDTDLAIAVYPGGGEPISTVQIGQGVELFRNGASTDTFEVAVSGPLPSGDYWMKYSGLVVSTLDSVQVVPTGSASRIRGVGASQRYGLDLVQLVGEESIHFQAGDIPLPSQATHLIDPDWSSLNDTLRIQVDDESDGIYDRELIITGTAIAVSNEPRNQRTAQSGLLHGNYPNPFAGETTLFFELPHPSSVVVELFDIQGRVVREQFSGQLPAGQHELRVSAGGLGAGLYFYRIRHETGHVTGKMIVLHQ